MCLFNSIVQEKELKTAVLFTSGIESFRTFIQMKHPDMYYDVVQGQSQSDLRIGFLTEKDSNKKRILKNYLNHDFVLESSIDNKKDENIILDLMRNHVFHTNSKLGNKILKNWKSEKFNFKKITPKATKTLNIESIYDSHISTRI